MMLLKNSLDKAGFKLGYLYGRGTSINSLRTFRYGHPNPNLTLPLAFALTVLTLLIFFCNSKITKLTSIQWNTHVISATLLWH